MESLQFFNMFGLEQVLNRKNMKNLQIENPKLAAKGLSIKKSYIQKVIYTKFRELFSLLYCKKNKFIYCKRMPKKFHEKMLFIFLKYIQKIFKRRKKL